MYPERVQKQNDFKMKYWIFFFTLLGLAACSTQGNTIKGITNLSRRADCQGPCGKIMPCEGKVYTLEVGLNGSNVLSGGRSIFVRDPDNYDYTVKIVFAENVPEDAYSGVREGGYKALRVTGTIEGYDVYVHEACTRSYVFKVKNASDFKLLH